MPANEVLDTSRQVWGVTYARLLGMMAKGDRPRYV
jgi:hypothetical protein